MPVIRGQEHERVAGAAMAERASQVEIEEGGLHRRLLAPRSVEMRDRVDAGPVRVHVRRTRRVFDQRAESHAHRRGQDVADKARLGRVHPRHRLRPEDLGLDDVRWDAALAQARVDRRHLDVAARVDGGIVEVRSAAHDRAAPPEHRGDLGELLEPQEIRDVAVLEGRSGGIHRRDRCRRR